MRRNPIQIATCRAIKNPWSDAGHVRFVQDAARGRWFDDGNTTRSTLMNIEFLSTIAVVTDDAPASRRLYVDTLGLPLESGVDGEYFHSEQLAGVKHFGVWPLHQAAEACFGTPTWPAERAVPQMSVEFDVADADAVQAAADELVAAGYEILHPVREEPWGQTVVRLQSPEGSILGVSYAPSLHV
jgi:catechol 2,3-dioxygenase-like lactoylglutathione lyase family enzyme